MANQWKEVARLAFKGKRFRDHAFDLNGLAELIQFQKMAAETAKALWREANPGRERLPKHFEERTRLCLRRIEEGSAVAPLEIFTGDADQLDMYEQEPPEISKAISLAYQVVRAIERDEALPEHFPRGLVPEYAKWGQGLSEDETIELVTDDLEPAQVTPQLRSRWTMFAESHHEARADITGEVLEADVRQKRFQVWIDEKTGITVSFSPDQEEQVTAALRDHRTRRLQVKGLGEFSPQGKLMHIERVEEMRLLPVGGLQYDASAPPIEDVLADLAREVPEREWKKLPLDITDNIDHYLYGWPKR